MAIAATALGASNNAVAVNTLALTTVANVAAGDQVVVPFGFSKTSNTPVVTDTSGNTYTITPVVEFVTGFEVGYVAYCTNATAMSSGGTITLNYSGAASRPVMAAATVSGIATSSALDITGTPQISSGTSASVGTGTLTQAIEIIFGITWCNNPGTMVSTGGGTFVGLTDSGASGNDYIRWAYSIAAAVTAQTYAPSWSSSTAFGSNIYTFKGLSAPVAATSSTLAMMGV